MAVFDKGSISQVPDLYFNSVALTGPVVKQSSTNASTSQTYTCAATDYGKLHYVTCAGGTFVVVNGASVSNQDGLLLAPGAVLPVYFDATNNKISYKVIDGLAFSASIKLTVCLVNPA